MAAPAHEPGASPASSADALLGYRERAMYPISIIAVVALMPFVVGDVMAGRTALAAAIVGTIAIFAANAIAIHLDQPPPIPFAVLVLPLAIAMTISLKTQGIYGAFWCYPSVVFFYFILQRRLAHVCSLSLLGFATLMVNRYIGTDVAIRFVVSLALVIVVVTVILNVVGDLHRRLVEQAIRDPLTGALNRRQMEMSIDLAIERRRRTGEPASLVLFDIDHFKQINDELGHAAGDRVLTAVVALVGQRARRMDLLFRIGGEEFMLLLAGAREADAVAVAEAIRRLVADAPLADNRRVTISIGVSELQRDQSLDAWIGRADAALYAAKHSGRNRIVAAGQAEQIL